MRKKKKAIRNQYNESAEVATLIRNIVASSTWYLGMDSYVAENASLGKILDDTVKTLGDLEPEAVMAGAIIAKIIKFIADATNQSPQEFWQILLATGILEPPAHWSEKKT